MITASEFFSPDFIIPNYENPQELVSECVNKILNEIETKLAKGTLVFEYNLRNFNLPMSALLYGSELKNSGYLQLISQLINDGLSEFGWVAYVSQQEVPKRFLVKLAIKDSELESVKQQIK